MSEPTRRTGRGFPPEEHRFKRGQSGNPAGRPRGSKNRPKADALGMLPSETNLLEEAARPVTLADGTKLSTSAAIARALNVGAIKGQRLSQKLALELIKAAEEKLAAGLTQLQQNVLAYKAAYRRDPNKFAARAGELGLRYPHPDDVHLQEDGSVRITGPCSAKEEKQLRRLESDIKQLARDIYQVRKEIQAQPDSLPLHRSLLGMELLYVDVRELLPERYGVRPINSLRWPPGGKVATPDAAYHAG